MDKMDIELVYALPEKQILLQFSVPKGTLLADAIILSNIMKQYPEIDLSKTAVGIFNKRIADPYSYILQPHDRIEIYRPLLADPKEVRRRRAEQIAQKNKS